MDFSQLCFVVADDDETIVEIIAASLSMFGAKRIIKCATGIAAIMALSDPNLKINCVISDCNMPPISGLDLLQGVRMGRFAHIARELPFIMVTVSGKEKVVKAALALDVSAYLMKPVTQKNLNTALNRSTSRMFQAKDAQDYAMVDITTD